MMHIDDYNCINVAYIVHAFMLDPCEEHPAAKQAFAIGLTLHIGKKCVQCALTYPTEGHRNAAFEGICELLRKEYGEEVEEEDERYET